MKPCAVCNRRPVPKPSDVPPTPALVPLIDELLRFAAEFDSLDSATYPAVDFAQWIAASVSVRPHPDQVDTRQSGQYERWSKSGEWGDGTPHDRAA